MRIMLKFALLTSSFPKLLNQYSYVKKREKVDWFPFRSQYKYMLRWNLMSTLHYESGVRGWFHWCHFDTFLAQMWILSHEHLIDYISFLHSSSSLLLSGNWNCHSAPQRWNGTERTISLNFNVKFHEKKQYLVLWLQNLLSVVFTFRTEVRNFCLCED